MKKLIGVTGYAQSGKDEIGRICATHGYNRVAFADEVKRIAFMMGWDGKKDERGRRFLQDIGNRAREYDQDVWVRLAFAEAQRYERMVFTDVRFLNEARWIKNAGGVLVRVVRDGVGPANDDVSETELEQIRYDFLVNNSTTLDDLRENVDRLMSRISGETNHENQHNQNTTGGGDCRQIPRRQEQDPCADSFLGTPAIV